MTDVPDKPISDRKYSIFNIPGLEEKNLAATAVVKSIKMAFPERDIVVVSEFPEIWLHNPNIFRVYKFGAVNYFHDDYMQNADTRIYGLDPYTSDDFIQKRKHLIQLWCDLYDIPYAGALPELFFTNREIEMTKIMMGTVTKPLFFLQTFAGRKNQPYPIAWTRDLPIPIVEQVVDGMIRHGYEPIHIWGGNQPQVRNTRPLTLPFRLALCSLQFARKRLFVDSFAQHAAAALSSPSVVTWLAQSPDIFGYKLHTNIKANLSDELRKFTGSFLEEMVIPPSYQACPYPLDAAYNSAEIIQALLQQK